MKKNKDFFYLQYNQLDWKNQEKTKINSFINDYIINNIILPSHKKSISLFDIGFGIGFFIKMLYSKTRGIFKQIVIEGCEPSAVNYQYFLKHQPKTRKGVSITPYKEKFLGVETDEKFDFITAIYVFPHFVFDELEASVRKIHSMLKEHGMFILALANEKYLNEKLKTEKDLFIESGYVSYRGKEYKEVLHYSNIPKIGKIIDYNREESFYIDLFSSNNFMLQNKKELNDNGFICTLFVFEKQ